jgi:hypothetical protein
MSGQLGGTIIRQAHEQRDPAARLSQPIPHVSRMMIAWIIQKNMDERQHRIERRDRFQKLDRRGDVNGQGLDHLGGAIVVSDRGGLAGFEIEGDC